MRGLGVALLVSGLATGVSGLTAGCHGRVACTGAACTAACPRDASPDATGRCACRQGTVEILGACVSPAIADAYCMPPARSTPSGTCAMPACASAEAVDMDTGCLPVSTLAGGGPRACPADASLVVDGRRAACIPRDAACPRGTRAEGPACASPVTCPAGSLPRSGACVSLVSTGVHGVPRVDVGSWAALVLGIDHGDGADALCRPLAAHPAAFGMTVGDKLTLDLRVVLAFLDQDVSSVHASVSAAPTSGHPLPAAGLALVQRAVDSLVEPLRGLGGEAAAAQVEVEVRCLVTSGPSP